VATVAPPFIPHALAPSRRRGGPLAFAARAPGGLRAGLFVFACLWGAAVAFSAVGAALLCVSFIACLLCLRDFRVGVMLLIVIMPVSSSTIFPHAMFGVTGLNPLNLLLLAHARVFLMRAAGTPALKGFLSRPLFWLFILPITAAAILGMQHVGEIPRVLQASEMILFNNEVGYLRDMLLKPFALVVYAMLVGARSPGASAPERFVIPMMVSGLQWMAGHGDHLRGVLGHEPARSYAGTYARHFLSTLGPARQRPRRLYAAPSRCSFSCGTAPRAVG
jgi:hypothetical protein